MQHHLLDFLKSSTMTMMMTVMRMQKQLKNQHCHHHRLRCRSCRLSTHHCPSYSHFYSLLANRTTISKVQ